MNIEKNLQLIKQNIDKACKKVGRKNDVEIIAVTKYVNDSTVEEALEAGVYNFGENRSDNYKKRKEKFNKKTWHLIGTLQTRKVKDVIDDVDYFHALDRMSLAKEIEKRATKQIKCFLQVNISNEETKHGFKKEEVINVINDLKNFQKIKIIGLMTMAPLTDDEKIIRHCFRELKNLKQEIQKLKLENVSCEFLSMGMSNDYTIAVEEGATHIRVGTSLVGKDL